MNPAILRTLEDWTTHQDYFWFLAVLAWGAFIGAEIRRKESGNLAANRWLIALAGFHVAGAMIELVLLAQDLVVPYTKLDFAMGIVQAGATATIVWGVAIGMPHRAILRTVVLLVVTGLAAARLRWPVLAGLGLCLVQAGALWVVLRRRPAVIPPAVVLLLVLIPVVATHGPWAYFVHHGRRTTDLSHFALLAAAVLAAAGAILAIGAWRGRLKEVMPDGRAGATLRRDLRRATMVLLAWLVGGVMLSVWYGARAREAFEENLLRRTEITALALDPALVAEALRAELETERITTQRFAHGAQIEVATIPETRKPIYAALRARLNTLRKRNSDLRIFVIGVVREGRLILLGSDLRRPGNPYVTHSVYPAATADLKGLERKSSYSHGPILSEQFPALFEARVPLFDPVGGEVLGWLLAGVDATRWAATFTQARLQTMALVAAGVGLWTVAVAYRLRREARDAAEQKAAASAAADRMKSVFLAKVSHELRTPIQSVLGYSELLASAPLGDPHRTWLGALRTHGDVMLRLVNDLIDLGALQSGAFQLELGPVKLGRVIDECVAALRPAVQTKGLAFEIDVASDLPTWVRTDGVRLRQIILNLLNNAVKFTPRGTVALAVQRQENVDMEFTVSDTGPGISPAQRLRLFQPFARLDPTAAGGSGLGLALVQGLCGVMGGRVTLVDSARGARFVVRLPLVECEPGVPKQVGGESMPNLSGRRILLAEDNTLVRDLLAAFLTEQGVELIVARDGVSALALAREHPPEVLLLDIALPGMDGIEVAETLRRESTFPLRIVGLSAHASAAEEARARQAGMDEFLPKPVGLAHLARVLAAQPRAGNPGEPAGDLDQALRARLVAQFARETPLVLAEMRLNLGAEEWTKLRRGAHYLKNSADVLGLRALQTACQQLYLLSDTADGNAARRLLEAVEEAIPPQLLVLEESG